MPKTGRELRCAREGAGLSAEQMAQRTKFKLYRIVALENGDFDNLPQGVYLDALVRAYAHEVGIDPEPMVERVRMERGKRPGDSPIPFRDRVDFERPRAAEDFPVVAHNVPVAAHTEEAAEPSRSTIAVSGLAVLAIVGWGSYVYEASGAAKHDIPGKIYAALTGRGDSQAAPQDAPVLAPNTMHVSNATQPVEPERVQTTAASNDVTGSWRLATQVESTSYTRYEGLLLGYELELEQDGDRVTGIGRKMIENGSGISSRDQTSIAISGIVDGDRLMLTFIEGGTERSSRGAFVLQRKQDGTLRGRFTTNAARSSGSAEARRVS